MLGIPQWAIGVVVIILVIAGAVMMVRWLQPEFERPELKSREGDLSGLTLRNGSSLTSARASGWDHLRASPRS